MKENAGYFMVICGALILSISASVLGISPGLFAAFDSPEGITGAFMLKLALFFLLEVLILFAIGRLSGIPALVSCDAINMMFLYLAQGTEFKVIFSATAVPILLLSATLAYYARAGKTLSGMLADMGIGRRDLAANIAFGVVGFVAIAALAQGLIFAADYLKIGDYGKTYEKLSTMPLLFLIIAVTLSPLAEELFFRGLLFQKYGYLASSAAFALAHWFYGSWVQVAAAFVLGLGFCALFAMRRSLIAPLVAHFLYNAALVFLLLYY